MLGIARRRSLSHFRDGDCPGHGSRSRRWPGGADEAPDELLLPGDALLLHVREGALELRVGARARRHPRDLLHRLLRRSSRGRGFRARRAVLLGFFAAFSLVYLLGFYNLDTAAGARPVREGLRQVRDPLRRSSRSASRGSGAAASPTTGARSRGSAAGSPRTRPTASLQLVAAQAGVNLDSLLVSPLTGGASQINIYGAVNGSYGLPAERPHRRPEPPRDHADRPAARPDAALPAARARATGCAAEARRPDRRSCSSSRSRRSRAAVCSASASARSSSRSPTAATSARGRCSRRSSARSPCSPSSSSTRLHFFLVVFRSRVQTGGGSQSAHFQVYGFIPQILHSHPLLGLGLNNFSIYYQAATGKTNWGPHSFYVSLIVETGLIGTVLFALFLLWVFVRLTVAPRARRRARAAPATRSPARPPARVGLDGGARRDDRRERLLPDDAVLLLLRLPGARARGPARLRVGRSQTECLFAPGAHAALRPCRAGCRLAPVARLRRDDVVSAVGRRRRRRVRRGAGRGAAAAGVDVDVVSPADVRHFGIAYGDGIVQNLRARPWLVLLLPLFLGSLALRSPAAGPLAPTSSTRTGSRRRSRALRDGQAVRPAGVGNRRRARAPRAPARPAARAPRAASSSPPRRSSPTPRGGSAPATCR